MFVIHNLVVACDNCNSGKGTDNILRHNDTTYGNNAATYPSYSIEYLIFNPHFDKWSDHFEIEDQYFLKAKHNTKGPATYHFCKMNRYQLQRNLMKRKRKFVKKQEKLEEKKLRKQLKR